MFPLSSRAQRSSRVDSIRHAAAEKRKVDSLIRVNKKLELKRQRDSTVTARKLQRSQDSINRILKLKRMRDSLELVRYRQQYGEEKYQKKLVELDRIRKQEEWHNQQRREDSIIIQKKEREQFVRDSIEEDIRRKAREIMVKDSLEKVRLAILKKEKEKEEQKAAALQNKITKDSLLMARRQAIKDAQAVRRQEEDIRTTAEEDSDLRQRNADDSLNNTLNPDVDPNAQNPPSSRPTQSADTHSNKPTEIEWLTEDKVKKELPPLPSYQMDSLRRVDSAIFILNSLEYRLARSTELSAYFGVSNYLGDLGGNSEFGRKFFYDNNFKKRNFFYGFSISHYRGEAVGFRLAFITGKISASDQDIAFSSYTDPAYRRYKRNLDFQTKINEWSFSSELYPFKLFREDHSLFNWRFQPYITGGIGRYSFNPQGSYYDDIVEDYLFIDLQPLRTEGQGTSAYPDRKPYSLRQWNMPYGIGVKYVFSRRTSISFEYIGRKLFTDYLDDVSTTYVDPVLFSTFLNAEDALIAKQVSNKSHLVSPDQFFLPGEDRGSSKFNDFYYSFNIRFSFRISSL